MLLHPGCIGGISLHHPPSTLILKPERLIFFLEMAWLFCQLHCLRLSAQSVFLILLLFCAFTDATRTLWNNKKDADLWPGWQNCNLSFVKPSDYWMQMFPSQILTCGSVEASGIMLIYTRWRSSLLYMRLSWYKSSLQLPVHLFGFHFGLVLCGDIFVFFFVLCITFL